MRYLYDKRYNPPAPVIELTVSSLGRKEGVSCEVLVDPGVNMTCIPEKIIESLGLSPLRTSQVRDYLGHTSPLPVYPVNISFLTFNMEVEVLPIKSKVGLIGRDILNQMTITLDGRKLVCEIE